jgi:ABC-type phosphate transport system substrate-binding protein
MSFNLRLKGSALALLPAATLASALVLGAAQTASAQTTLFDCTNNATAPGGVCSSGVGTTFSFPLFFNFFPVFADNAFNYAARGSSNGIRAFLACGGGGSIDTPTLPNPVSFASVDTPLTQAQIDSYYSATGCFSQGFGPIVELPITAGAVALVYNTNADLNDGENANLGGSSGPVGRGSGVNLRASQYCALFNGTPAAAVPALPADLAAATGVRRSDGSGTTFIQSSSLNAICTPLGAWTTAQGQSRGFGQVSVNDDALDGNNLSICGKVFVPSGSISPTDINQRTNTVCWPASFLSGSGNPGVATLVNAAANRFGYVEFATAAGLDAPVPGTTFNAVDIDLIPANNTAGTNRIFPNLDIADLQNPNTAEFFAPYSGNVEIAEATKADDSRSTCRTVFNNPNPIDGYPISGVSYLLFYGDYQPEIRPNGVASPASTRFLSQGATLRDRYRSFFAASNPNSFAGTAGRQLQINLGYAPLPVARQTQAFVTATQCIQSVNGLNTRDPLPGGQVAP